MTEFANEASPLMRDFLSYHESVRGHSAQTVDEYFLDLRAWFRYEKRRRKLVEPDVPDETIPVNDVDLNFIKTIALSDIYAYLNYLTRERHLNNTSRARKISTIRSLYRYLCNKTHQLDQNPVQDLDSPVIRKSLPKYLTLEESLRLLSNVHSRNPERDFCILVLFLNCGLRISELIGMNVSDLHGDTIRILGKGNKERILFLNDSCKDALEDYLIVRNGMNLSAEPALFVSNQRKRMSRSTVHLMVKNSLAAAGLDATQYSSHKLRHTAATLMLQNGVDVRTLQEVLGHDHLNTTQIYTHIDSDDLRIAAKANPLSTVKKRKKEPQQD